MEDLETALALSDDDNVFLSPQHGVKMVNQAKELFGISPVQVNPNENQNINENQTGWRELLKKENAGYMSKCWKIR